MYSRQFLSFEEARSVAEAALAEAAKHPDRPCAIAVVDPIGDLIYFGRQDYAPAHFLMLATDKAYTAARFRRDTVHVEDTIKLSGLGIKDFIDPRYTKVPGGICIKTPDGTVIGAIGISGRNPRDEIDDLAVGEAGLKVLSF